MIKPDSRTTLDEIAKLLRAQPHPTLVIVGHAASQGTHDYNMALSRRRAGLITDGSETNDLVSRLCAARLLASDAQVVVLDRDQHLLQRALEAVDGSRIYMRAAAAA